MGGLKFARLPRRNRLAVLRVERRWTQIMVAHKLGYRTRFRYWQLENDESLPTPKEITKLCKMFRCDLGDIYPHLKVAAPSANTAA